LFKALSIELLPASMVVLLTLGVFTIESLGVMATEDWWLSDYLSKLAEGLMLSKALLNFLIMAIS